MQKTKKKHSMSISKELRGPLLGSQVFANDENFEISNDCNSRSSSSSCEDDLAPNCSETELEFDGGAIDYTGSKQWRKDMVLIK